MEKVKIIGGGLAGSEAALQLAKRGIDVELYEMRPKKTTGAHVSSDFAEFVCSNSLGSSDVTNASGLLKKEMEIMGGELIKIAYECSVPAGNALAIDRELFSKTVTEKIQSNGKITVVNEEVTEIPDGNVIIASGPLTSDSFANSIKEFNKGEASYINCPMDKEQYEKFYNYLINAPRIELKEFEKDAKVFEGCMPIEVMASRGVDTLRFGPLKPVGLVDKRTEKINYAVVQLRQDNSAKTLYNLVGFQTNLKWSAQKELLSLIPGLERANIMRYGVMHRNTFINSPELLNPTLESRGRKGLFFAGQITGTEGYTESIATGMLSGVNMARLITDKPLLQLPTETMLGALTHYITEPQQKHFQPINSNWAIVKEMDIPKKIRKNKKEKNKILSDRSIQTLSQMNFS